MRTHPNRATFTIRLRIPGPALRQAYLACVLIGASLVAGCVPPGTRVAGLESVDLRRLAERDGGEVWLALPMGKWLGTRENVGRPEALIACIAATCRNRLVVGVFRLEGETADRAERDLRDPQMLARGLAAQQDDQGNGNGSGAADRRIDIDVASHAIADLSGFTISLTTQRPRSTGVHAAAIGRREGRDLRVILAVGDDPQVVRAALAQVHAETF
ncbi:MAG: hypothetical protein JJU21_08030 [Salinarimonas sp.]|nr:hypothetical protein [Salinarimonas sp.]